MQLSFTLLLVTVRKYHPTFNNLSLRLGDTGKHTFEKWMEYHANQFFLSSLHTTWASSVGSLKNLPLNPLRGAAQASFFVHFLSERIREGFHLFVCQSTALTQWRHCSDVTDWLTGINHLFTHLSRHRLDDRLFDKCFDRCDVITLTSQIGWQSENVNKTCAGGVAFPYGIRQEVYTTFTTLRPQKQAKGRWYDKNKKARIKLRVCRL